MENEDTPLSTTAVENDVDESPSEVMEREESTGTLADILASPGKESIDLEESSKGKTEDGCGLGNSPNSVNQVSPSNNFQEAFSSEEQGKSRHDVPILVLVLDVYAAVFVLRGFT